MENIEMQLGLSEKEVEERIQGGKQNTPVEAPSKSVKEIVLTNVFTYFNLIFAVIAGLLILVGAFRELTFLPIIIANTLVGIVQEYRSKKILDKLAVLHAPKANVIREGKRKIIRAEELVLDDVVVFAAGNQIPADAIVVSGEVQVNESLITGEADEITKVKGDSVLSGSYIVSGRCLAKLTKVGADSYVSKLTLEAKAVKEGEQSEMIRSLNKLVKAVGIIIIPIGLMMFYQQYILSENTLRKSVTSMTAAIIGMIPEGLYLLASVALVVSVMKLAKKKVLVHDMKCIETLARVNVLCVDKTGTITENVMKVNEIISYGEDKGELEEQLSDFVFNMEKDNTTMEALKNHFRMHMGRTADKITTFSSEYKYSSAVLDGITYVLGAPEFVLREEFETYREEIEKQSEQGYRVLVFAKYDGETDGKALTEKATLLGLILLSNPIRKNAKETFHYFAEQGVDIKVISGDNPMTVSKVALEAGIANAENYVDARQLKSEEDIDVAVRRYTVFGRVTPKQKRMFVQALKKDGKTVAMTGDGVNDVLALKDADCSIAMASGSDVASQASQLVLLESDFAKMPSVVAEGRQVVNNIERSASLFLVKNIFSFLLSALSLIFMITYPLGPAQVSLVSMMTIGTPAFLLAMEPNKNLIKGKFLTNVLLKALPAGLTDVIMVGLLILFGSVFGVSSEEISITATLLLAIVGLQILFELSKPMNIFRWVVWFGMLFGLLICVLFMGELFGINQITLKSGLLLLVFAFATMPVFNHLCQFIRKAEEFFIRINEKKKKRKAEKYGQ
ncbi:cation-translocating P-type ATPase [Faecalimonas sp.]